MKHKAIIKLLGLTFLSVLVLLSCRKMIDYPVSRIDLGIKSMATGIVSVSQYNNFVRVRFMTTPGAKYSVQITGFGDKEPARVEGFTATADTTLKVYDLRELPKKDYQLVLIDISGKESKTPILIK